MHAILLPDQQAFLRYLEIPGADPPLIWLHGWQCSSSGELLPAAVQEPLRGRRSLLVDFLGHGYSDKPPDFPYSIEAHADTIVALIDALELRDCGLVGHSMGGAVAVLVAAARPAAVSLLALAEGVIDPRGDEPFGGQSETQFLDAGFRALVDAQAREAAADPTGIRARHIEMTRLIEPRALYREDASMVRGANAPIREVLGGLRMPRWYVIGEWSDPEGDEQALAAIGVGWRVVADAGHPMALQNPSGVAQAVADVAAEAWSAPTRAALLEQQPVEPPRHHGQPGEAHHG